MGRWISGTIALLLAAAPATAARQQAAAIFEGLDGKPIGHAELVQTARGVLIELDLHGLPPGAHGVHVRQNGVCDPKTHFTSAGAHLSLAPALFAARPHGYFAKGGPDEGDLPNQFAASDGTLHASTLTNAFTLGKGEKSVFARGNAAIVIDSRADDYQTQPAGNAGSAIACGVIVRTQEAPRRAAPSRSLHK
jgi:Cu-Zn family superoxide dismutase